MPKVEDVKLKNITLDDIIIALMGPPGAGKSTFIDIATKQGRKTIGHALESYMSDIRTVRVPNPNFRDNRPIVFVDTPSFDDTNKSDMEILTLIADWLKKTYKNKNKLAGIIYLHRISDNRMSRSPLKNLRIFANLCGDDAVRNVILATTMWNRVQEAMGSRREEELREQYWKPMLDHGSDTDRFDGTFDGAWRIIQRFVEKTRINALLLQEEMLDLHRRLNETQAGIALYHALQKLLVEQKEAVRRLLEKAEGRNNAEVAYELNRECEKVQGDLRNTLDQMHRMKIPFSRRVYLLTISRTTRGRPLNWDETVRVRGSRGSPRPVDASPSIWKKFYGNADNNLPSGAAGKEPTTPILTQKIRNAASSGASPHLLVSQSMSRSDTADSVDSARQSSSRSISSHSGIDAEGLPQEMHTGPPGHDVSPFDLEKDRGLRASSAVSPVSIKDGEVDKQGKQEQSSKTEEVERCEAEVAARKEEAVQHKEESDSGHHVSSDHKTLLHSLFSQAECHPSIAITDLTGQVEVEEEEQASGGFAAIYRGCWTNDQVQHDVAVKVLFVRRPKHAGVIRLIKQFVRELRPWHRLDHPNVVKLLGISFHDGWPAIIMPWHRNGNAKDYLAETENSVTIKVMLIIDIARALVYLHNLDPPIVHGDLKGNNVLITDDGHAALTDFGLSQIIEERTCPTGLTTTTVAGSVRWQAPEVLRGDLDVDGKRKLTTASDVWSFACTAYEVLTGKLPYDKRNQHMVSLDIINGLKPQWEENSLGLCEVSDELQALLDRCWSSEPSDRPSMRDILPQLETLAASF